MRDTATSFALQAEQSVQRDSIGSGDISALCPEFVGVVYRSRRALYGGEAIARFLSIEHQTIKKPLGTVLALSRTR